MNATTQKPFDADVSKLLDIVINALYTNHDVFLRELISNAADACDKLRYESIQNPELIQDQQSFRVHIYPDTEKRRLIVTDNGIGMNADELADHLGTIAKSGTQALMQQVKEAKSEDQLKLIGQFGVGFYASFMVADHVDVVSRRAGNDAVNVWSSDGKSGYTIREAGDEEKALLDGQRGTAIILHLKDDGSDFLLEDKLRQTVMQYSDHIDVKIFVNTPQDTEKGEGAPANTASALWTRSKSEITDEQYTEFYRHISHGFDEPLSTIHWKAEGKIEFSALLYIPTMRPWDLYDPGRKTTLKLYVRRVFISDSIAELSYPWLRFVRGVVDSEDLPLNISRETLQHNPLITKIRSAVAKKVLSELDKLSRNDEAAFLTFWGQFGAALKEGLYDAPEHREAIFKLCRFGSTAGDNMTSLDGYIERMKDSQDEIYYISGEDAAALKNSPQIEGFKARGLEVLYFTDTIDDFWLQQSPDYKGKKFKSVTKGDIDLDKFTQEKTGGADSENKEGNEQAPKQNHDKLIAMLQTELAQNVSIVKLSNRLTDSPVCLVAPESGVDMNMERVLKLHQNYQGDTKPVLEINGGHALIKRLSALAENDDAAIKDAAPMLLDQARIIQGQPVSNPAEFVRRLSEYMGKAI